MSLYPNEDQLAKALENINNAYNKFKSLYSALLESGLDRTEYNEAVTKMAEEFKRIYAMSFANQNTLLMNRRQFEEGRLERDAFERSLLRISTQIHESEFEIDTRILVRLKQIERELLDKHIIGKVETLNVPPETREEILAEARTVREQFEKVESKAATAVEKVDGYVETGKRILEVGRKLWKVVQKVAPTLTPTILRLFGVPF